MYIPKSVLLGLLVAAAGVVGWMLNGLTSESDPAADATPTAATGSAEPDPGDAADGDASGDTIVNVVLPPDGGTAATPAAVLTTTSGTAGTSAGPEARADGAAPGDTRRADTSATAPDARPERGRPSARPEHASAVDRAPSGTGDGGVTYSRAPGTAPPIARGGGASGGPGGLSLSLGGDQMGAGASDFAVSAAGNHIVIAYDDSIVFIGDDGRLTANTGDASSSGTVALEVAGSDLASGDSRTTPASPAMASSTLVAGPGGAAQSTTGTLDLSQAPGRGVAISGYEDHSISVVGTDNVATYDDSNVFIARDGQINANTGDTDSSGLNVVDAVGSVVRSGDHSDGDDDDSDDVDDEPEDTEEPEEAEEAPEADSATATTAAPAPVPAAATSASPPAQGDPAPRSTGVVADEGDTSASGDSTVVIGADGYDDLALDVAGHGNVATYDDSNTVVGGSGDVNAQIGDSDTGGAVVMGVEGSVIEAGRSN